MRHEKFTPRADHRLSESLRSQASPTLSEKFRELKSLTVEVSYFSPDGVKKNSELKCTFHQDAKSLIRFDCQNQECIRGDFDLTDAVTRAIAAHRDTVTGELCCNGWLSKTTIDRVHCHNILRYKLSITY